MDKEHVRVKARGLTFYPVWQQIATERRRETGGRGGTI